MPEKILTEKSLEEHFKDEIEKGASSQHIKLTDITCFYLVNLLKNFHKRDNLFIKNSDGSAGVPILAFLLAEALNSNTKDRVVLLRKLGDISLYIAGYFQDSLNKKIIDIDYYIDMGGSAYWQLTKILENSTSFKDFFLIFSELASQFLKLVDLLAAISEKSASTNKDLLRLYEKWLLTKSDRLKKILHDKGIIPNENIKKEYIH
jgi:hypothetical protein